MEAKLISITPNIEKTIMYVARVSSANQDSGDPKLLEYCIRHGHWSVFEHGFMTIEVECPLFVATQILRHRSFTFQQFSQRYAKSDLDFHLQETRLQDKSNRQSSNSTEDAELINEWIERQIVLYHAIERDYEWAIKKGIAKECARVILPQSVMTKLYVSGNVRSWIHYLQSRCDPSTQKEHREVAELCKGIFISQLPIVSEAMKYNKETQ